MDGHLLPQPPELQACASVQLLLYKQVNAFAGLNNTY